MILIRKSRFEVKESITNSFEFTYLIFKDLLNLIYLQLID